MIRWYDWPLAFITADLLAGAMIYAITAEKWYISFFGTIIFLLLWDIWTGYCNLRKKLESRK